MFLTHFWISCCFYPSILLWVKHSFWTDSGKTIWGIAKYSDPQLEMIPICKIIDSKTVYDEAFYMVYLFQKMKQIFQRRVWDYYNIKDELLCKKWNNRKPLFAAEVFGEVFKFCSQIWLQPIDTEAEWDSPVLWYRMI